MAAVLGAYGSALLLAHATHQHAQLMVLAVVLTLTLERTQRTADLAHRARSLVLLPLVAIAASQVGPLLVHHPNAGDALFVIAIAGSIWVRRFGTAAARAGTLVALPFIALLTTPVVAAPGSGDPTLWAAVVAVIAFTWVTALHLATGSFGAAALPARAAPPVGAGRPGRAASPRRAKPGCLARSSRPRGLERSRALARGFEARPSARPPRGGGYPPARGWRCRWGFRSASPSRSGACCFPPTGAGSC